MEYTIFNLLTYFIIYSIAGWVLESIYRSFCEKKIINTGFLNGPFCPIYGIGAITMILFFKPFKKYTVLLFLISFIVLSLWEYFVGVLLEKFFKTRYWDYSDHKIHIKGRVCLFNSICWGILGVVFIKFIHPYVEYSLTFANPYFLKVIIYIITILAVIDTIISVISVKNLHVTLNKIEELNSQIKEKLNEIRNANNKNYKIELIENIQNKIYKLKKQKDRIFRNLYRRVYRLKKAFPDIQNNEITEILNRKIEFIKKDKNTKEEK